VSFSKYHIFSLKILLNLYDLYRGYPTADSFSLKFINCYVLIAYFVIVCHRSSEL